MRKFCEETNSHYLPGAFAKDVIFSIEPVGSACMRFAGDQREQVRGDTPPGAFAKAVISTIEAVGTRPTNANKSARTPRREQVRGDSPLSGGRGACR